MFVETPETSDEKLVRSQMEAQSGLCTKGVVSARNFVAVGLGVEVALSCVETEVGVVNVICPRWDVKWSAGSACGEIYTLSWWISRWTSRWICICCVHLARLEYERRRIWPRPWYWGAQNSIGPALEYIGKLTLLELTTQVRILEKQSIFESADFANYSGLVMPSSCWCF